MSRSPLASALIVGLALTSCSTAIPAASPASGPATSAAPRKAAARPTAPALVSLPSPGSALRSPAALAPFAADRGRGAGAWTPACRAVGGGPAVYETTLIPPGGTQPAGIAWMDTGLLSAWLYSGSVSPGGGPYRYTAPVLPAQARTLVTAFNGGFKMNDARGGYYTEGRTIDPLRPGAASLVIYADGTIDLGAWGSEVTMTAQVASVRQNLAPLVAGGRSTVRAAGANWQQWGSTCAATSCGHGIPGVEHQWRSGLGIAADGALIYGLARTWTHCSWPSFSARRGGTGHGTDINPAWPVSDLRKFRDEQGHYLRERHRALCGTLLNPRTIYRRVTSRFFIHGCSMTKNLLLGSIAGNFLPAEDRQRCANPHVSHRALPEV